MILLIARKELLDHLLSLKFHVSMAVMTVLLGLSGYVMYQDYRLRMDNYAVQKQRAVPRPGEAGLMVVVEPRALSVFAKGLDEVMTRGYTLTAYLGIEPFQRQTPAESLFSLFAPPDLLYIVKVLLSLIAVLFAYDAVSGEKETGTLKLVLSSAISRGRLVAGKMLGGLAAIMLPLVTLLTGVVVVLVAQPGIRLVSGDFARLGLLVVAAMLYVALFFALGMLVSTLARTSATALMVLLLLWAGIVFAIPNVGNLVAEQLAPAGSAQTQEMLRRQGFAKNRFLAIQSRGRDPEGSAAAFNREYDRLVEEHRSKLDATIGMSKNICRLSPAATLTYIFTDLAGTGLEEQRRLNRVLMEFKSRMLERGRRTAAEPLQFEFRPAGVAEVFQRGALADFSLLALTCAVLFALASIAFVRTDPR